MLDILRDYLASAATPEMLAAVEQAHAVFDEINLENFEEKFEEILMTDDGSDLGSTVTNIVSLTNSLQAQILLEHGVELAPVEIRTSTTTELIRGLIDIQDYEDHDTVISTLSVGGNPEEVFCELLQLVTSKTADEWLQYVDRADRALLARIGQLHTTTIDPAYRLDANKLRIEGLREFCRLTGGDNLYVLTILRSGVDVGFSFKVYVDPALESLPARQAARELIAASFVCSDSANNPRATIKNHVQDHISSLDKITAIDVEISKILLDFNNRQKAPL